MPRPLAILGLAFVFLSFPVNTPAQEPGRPQGERYALLVGVRTYNPEELRPLAYAEADVTELADVLKHDGYRPENVVLMTGARATEDFRYAPTVSNIRRELNLLLRGREEGDTVLIALAGHGVQFRGEVESYFCPVDARLVDKATLISLNEIYAGLERCEAGVRMMLIDACRNDPQSDHSRARSVVQLDSVTRPQRARPPGGVVALFSCFEGERAYEHEELKHGVFFHFVIQGLKGGAVNPGDREVTVPDLERYVKRQVSDFVRVKFSRPQMPERIGRERGLVPLVRPARVLFNQAEAARLGGHPDWAIADYTEAIRLDPKFSRAYGYRGNAYVGKGELDRAIADYTEAIRLDPKSEILYWQRASVYDAKGDHARAQADLEAAAELQSL
jgi:hypothetical protein